MVESTRHNFIPHIEHIQNRRQSHVPLEAKRVRQAFQILNSLQSEWLNVLRPGQFEVFGDVIKHLLIGHQAGYIELPTGSGKTVISSWLIDLLHENAIIIAPTAEIVDQYVQTLKDFTRVEPIKHVGSSKAASVELSNHQGRRVIIATQDAFRRKTKGKRQEKNEFLAKYSPDDYPLLIIDEAHKFIGEESLKALEEYRRKKDCRVIALTATPDYNLRSDHTVERKIGPLITRLTIQKAVDWGIICPFKVFQITVGTTPDNFTDRDVRIRRQKASAVNQETGRMIIPELLRQPIFVGKKAIVRYNSIEDAEHAAKFFSEKSPEQPAFVLHGNMSITARREIIDLYRRSVNGVLFGVDIVGLGLDVPDVSVMVMVGESESTVKLIQTAGRALRPGDCKTGYVVHITTPSAFPKYPGIPVTYVDALIQTDQDIPNIHQRVVEGTMHVFSPTYGATISGNLTQIADIKQRGVNENGKVPEGFISLAHVFGGKRNYQTDLYTYVFARACHEITPDNIYVGRAMDGNLIHPPAIYLSSRAVSRCVSIRKELENWDEDEYVTAAQVADFFGYKHQTAVKKLNTFYPSTEDDTLGVVKKTERGGGGQLVRLYPIEVLQDIRIGTQLDIANKQDHQGEQQWFSLTDLRVAYPGFPHQRFIAFAQTEHRQSLVMEGINTRRKQTKYYALQLVQDFFDQEIAQISQNWLSRKQIRNMFGIQETKLDSLFAQLDTEQSQFGRREGVIGRYFSPEAVMKMLSEYGDIHGAYSFIEKIINVIAYQLQYSGILVDKDVLYGMVERAYGLSSDELTELLSIQSNKQPRFTTDKIPQIIDEYRYNQDQETLHYTPLHLP